MKLPRGEWLKAERALIAKTFELNSLNTELLHVVVERTDNKYCVYTSFNELLIGGVDQVTVMSFIQARLQDRLAELHGCKRDDYAKVGAGVW